MVQPSSIWEQDKALSINASNQQYTDLQSQSRSSYYPFSAVAAKKRKYFECLF